MGYIRYVALILSLLWLELSAFRPLKMSRSAKSVRGKVTMAKMTESTMKFAELEDYAAFCGLRIEKIEKGIQLRLEAYPLRAPKGDKEALLGYLEAFIRPIPFKLFQLDTIKAKNQRQNSGYKRKNDNWTMDGPGISFIMGSMA